MFKNFKKIYLIPLLLIPIAGYFALKKPQITTIKIEKSSYKEDILVSGNVKSKETLTISSQVPGKILSVNKKEGDVVVKGDTLVILDTTDILLQIEKEKENYRNLQASLNKLSTTDLSNAQSTVASAKEQYLISKGEFEKYQTLFNKGLLSELEYNQKKSKLSMDTNSYNVAQNNYNSILKGNDKTRAEALLSQSEINLRTLNENLEKLTIKSPINGVITKKSISDSAFVNPGVALLEISSNDEKILEFNIDEKQASKITLEQEINAFFNNNPSLNSSGKIYYIAPFVDSSSGTVTVKATLNDQKPEFLYNITLNAKILGKPIDNAIVINDEYLVANKNSHYVLKVVNGKITPAKVEIPLDTYATVQILSGLEVGDEIALPTDKLIKEVNLNE